MSTLSTFYIKIQNFVHKVVDNHFMMWYLKRDHNVDYQKGERHMENQNPENPIRGAVFKKFSSITEFADAIGWSRNKASRIVNGEQSPSAEDMEQMAVCLDIVSAEKFMPVFFPQLSTM